MNEQKKGPSQEEIDGLRWWHPFTFPNGVKTSGQKGGRERNEELVRTEGEIVFKYPVRENCFRRGS
jgi:hypothetical protein